MRLSARLLILVLIAALPIFALQVHELVEEREQRKAAIAEQALDLARLAAAQQDQFIEAARYLLVAAAQFPEVGALDPAGCSAQMVELRQRFPNITGIGAVTPDGIPFCSSSGDPQRVSIADRPYFQNSVRDKRLTISGFIIGRVTGEPTINFAYPVLDDDREVQAVVVLAFALGQLSQSLSSTQLPPGATMSLVDGDGVLLARAPPAPDWIGRQVQEAAFVQSMLRRREGVQESVGVDGVERLYGFAPLLASADLFAMVGLPWRDAFRAADRQFWWEAAMTALAFVVAAVVALLSGEVWIRRPVAALERVVGRMDSGDLAARARLERGSSPELKRLAASFNHMAGSLEARETAVRASETRLRAVVEHAPDGIITVDQHGTIRSVNPAAERLFGYQQNELVGRDLEMLMFEARGRGPGGSLASSLFAGEDGARLGHELTGRRQDGSAVPLLVSVGEFDLEGERFSTVIVRDITNEKRAAAHQRMLMAEIDHRAKNLLAAIQAMVQLTRSSAHSVRDYAKTLVGRLHAMSRAHDLLARDKWQGARLHDLVRGELAAYVGADGDALQIVGEDVLLNPRAAQTLSLALHELTTNAAKYGALSVPGGRVTVRSSIENSPSKRTLLISWTESGGPKVTPPKRRGFGSVAIERSIAHELDGSATLEFNEAGLHCLIRVPLA